MYFFKGYVRHKSLKTTAVDNKVNFVVQQLNDPSFVRKEATLLFFTTALNLIFKVINLFYV